MPPWTSSSATSERFLRGGRDGVERVLQRRPGRCRDVGRRWVRHGCAGRDQVRAEKARRNLAEFVRRAWIVRNPGRQLRWAWYLHAMCDHLQAVTQGRIRRLAITLPPNTLKSFIVSVCWPAWQWATDPSLRFLAPPTTVRWLLATRWGCGPFSSPNGSVNTTGRRVRSPASGGSRTIRTKNVGMPRAAAGTRSVTRRTRRRRTRGRGRTGRTWAGSDWSASRPRRTRGRSTRRRPRPR